MNKEEVEKFSTISLLAIAVCFGAIIQIGDSGDWLFIVFAIFFFWCMYAELPKKNE